MKILLIFKRRMSEFTVIIKENAKSTWMPYFFWWDSGVCIMDTLGSLEATGHNLSMAVTKLSLTGVTFWVCLFMFRFYLLRSVHVYVSRLFFCSCFPVCLIVVFQLPVVHPLSHMSDVSHLFDCVFQLSVWFSSVYVIAAFNGLFCSRFGMYEKPEYFG